MALQKSAIAFGTFDGLHIGHLAVLKAVTQSGYKPIAVTFEVPPKMKNKLELILRTEEKIALINKMGIETVVLNFDSVKNIPPKEFLEQIFEKYNPALISVGFDFRFGKEAAGDTETVKEFCREKRIECNVCPAVSIEDKIASSTEIRKSISNGDVERATAILGRPFSFTGEISHGDKRGRVIGFPTINIVYPENLVVPKFGVYLSEVVVDGKAYKGITNLGLRPTFKTDVPTSETHIFDFNSEVYGKMATISLLKFLREESRFNSLEKLKEAIQCDIASAKLLK